VSSPLPPFLPVRSRQATQPTINIVPLVDVLLVLLVILLVTAPTLFHMVRTQLPRASSEAHPPPRTVVTLTVSETGQWLWNGEAIHRAALASRLIDEQTATGAPLTIVIAVHRAAPFEPVAQLMAELSRAGITDARFLLDPQGH